ncbi:MAG: DUF3108 domain-containing protein [Rhodocyclaceae bacterium]|nr:DUF3108 domain-containing protein [Rhodocyclaceae bacterium]
MYALGARRSFWLALALSLLLHAALLCSPGWSLPQEEEARTLDATLLLPPPTPLPTPIKPQPARKAPSPPPKPPAAPSMPEVPTPPAGEASASEPPASAEPPASIAEAVPPAPTFAPSSPLPPRIGRLPASGRIVFRVIRGEGFVIGESEQRWQHDGERYELVAKTRTTGLAALFRPVEVVQESRGRFDAHGLRPLAFERWQNDKLKERIRFLPEENSVEINGLRVEFVAGTQDLLSIFYQLGVLEAETPLGVAVAAGRRVSTYAVTVGPVAPVELPQGVRSARAYTIVAGNEETLVWLDADSWLPIKIRHKDRKGEVYEQLATLIEIE